MFCIPFDKHNHIYQTCYFGMRSDRLCNDLGRKASLANEIVIVCLAASHIQVVNLGLGNMEKSWLFLSGFIVLLQDAMFLNSNPIINYV